MSSSSTSRILWLLPRFVWQDLESTNRVIRWLCTISCSQHRQESEMYSNDQMGIYPLYFSKSFSKLIRFSNSIFIKHYLKLRKFVYHTNQDISDSTVRKAVYSNSDEGERMWTPPQRKTSSHPNPPNSTWPYHWSENTRNQSLVKNPCTLTQMKWKIYPK